jgi:hypothetical protein
MPLRLKLDRRKIAQALVLCANAIAALIYGLPAAMRLVKQDHNTRRITALHPDFPVVDGHYQVTKRWSVELPEKFNKRLEDDTLVIWRPGLTFWFSIWKNDQNQSQEERLTGLKARMSADAFDVQEVRDNLLIRLSYRLKEQSEDNRAPAFYAFVIGADGHVRMGVYFDKEADAAVAQTAMLSVTESSKR